MMLPRQDTATPPQRYSMNSMAMVPVSNAMPPNSVGVDPDDLQMMQQRLKERWDPETRLRALEQKIEEYADRHGGMRNLSAAEGMVASDPEMEILKKVVADGEDQLQTQHSEVATLEVLESGVRDYIDYALAEVDRYGHRATAGERFDWRSQGKANDIPALFRSQAENWVGRGPPRAAREPLDGTASVLAIPATQPDPQDERFSIV
eukprot:CAMPEP_0179209548 /NCGR_PEP_ID=MMETSP0796-20121207/104509_1 /TAXON_ID=73915 /ORGANISM="Pyrodinium bahamense, Strain pbaha01" /LENGTH=205 /DNA_ID=CAMNT_0020914507 /DNA_START=29 /DNA_END=646 /DNA_ORIENTATION=+